MTMMIYGWLDMCENCCISANRLSEKGIEKYRASLTCILLNTVAEISHGERFIGPLHARYLSTRCCRWSQLGKRMPLSASRLLIKRVCIWTRLMYVCVCVYIVVTRQYASVLVYWTNKPFRFFPLSFVKGRLLSENNQLNLNANFYHSVVIIQVERSMFYVDEF